jgi:hypothetical protein
MIEEEVLCSAIFAKREKKIEEEVLCSAIFALRERRRTL